MGTLSILKPATVFSLTPATRSVAGSAGWKASVSGLSTDAELINAFSTPGDFILYAEVPAVSIASPVSRIASFGFDTTTPIFVLDGNPPVNFNNLPAGFLMRATILGDVSSAPLGTSSSFEASLRSSLAQIIPFPQSIFTSFLSPGLDIVLNNAYISASQFIASQYNVSYIGTYDKNLTFSSVRMNTFSFIGDYAIAQLNFSLTPPTATTGDDLNISGTTDNVIAAEVAWQTNVNGLTVNNTLTAPIVTVNPLVVIVPPGIPPYVGIVKVILSIKSTQFTGKIEAGEFTFILGDRSGIYKIVKGKTSDTIYDHAGSSTEFKIPSPFIKTGYVGG